MLLFVDAKENLWYTSYYFDRDFGKNFTSEKKYFQVFQEEPVPPLTVKGALKFSRGGANSPKGGALWSTLVAAFIHDLKVLQLNVISMPIIS